MSPPSSSERALRRMLDEAGEMIRRNDVLLAGTLRERRQRRQRRTRRARRALPDGDADWAVDRDLRMALINRARRLRERSRALREEMGVVLAASAEVRAISAERRRRRARGEWRG